MRFFLLLDSLLPSSILFTEMNKVAIIVVVLLLLGVGGYFVIQRSSNPAMNSNSAGGNPFTSIQDALSRSLSLECTFVDDEGRQTKTYIKAGAVRTDFTGATTEESGSMVMKNKKLYTWTNAKKEGFMMEVPDVDVTPSQTKTTTSDEAPNPANTLAMLEKYKDSCKPGTVADSLFTPPSDIKFTDYSQMMKQFTQPTGGAINEDSVKDLMEKYGKDQ